MEARQNITSKGDYIAVYSSNPQASIMLIMSIVCAVASIGFTILGLVGFRNGTPEMGIKTGLVGIGLAIICLIYYFLKRNRYVYLSTQNIITCWNKKNAKNDAVIEYNTIVESEFIYWGKITIRENGVKRKVKIPTPMKRISGTRSLDYYGDDFPSGAKKLRDGTALQWEIKFLMKEGK